MRSDAFTSLRRKRRIALQIVVVMLAVAGYVVASEGNTTRFQMLPALQTDAASDSLILDATTNGQRILVAGEQGHILYSDDSGTSWTHAQVPVSLAITAVTFCGSNCAWVAAHDGVLLRSTDQGKSWQTNLTGVDIARLSADAAEAMINQLQAEIEQANPDSLEAGIKVLCSLPGEAWLALGDMAELGSEIEILHKKSAQMAKKHGVKKLFGVGAMSCLASEEFGSDGYCYDKIDDMAVSIIGQIHQGVNLLVKGSRSAGMDKLIQYLTHCDGQGDVNHAV